MPRSGVMCGGCCQLSPERIISNAPNDSTRLSIHSHENKNRKKYLLISRATEHFDGRMSRRKHWTRSASTGSGTDLAAYEAPSICPSILRRPILCMGLYWVSLYCRGFIAATCSSESSLRLSIVLDTAQIQAVNHTAHSIFMQYFTCVLQKSDGTQTTTYKPA